MKIDKDWVDAYFDRGVDVANRRVFIGDIDTDSVNDCIKGLYLMETESDTKPCEMFISSYGGTLYDALALYDIMGTIKCPIHTFGYGKIMSAAPLLLAAGEPGHRWVAEHASLMHHDWNSEMEGRGAYLKEEVKHSEELGEVWTRLLTKHTNKDFRFWNQKANKPADFYFSAEQAIEWGIADAIWTERS